MRIGILVNTDRHMNAVLGLTEAALGRGHQVTIFCMDEGTRLLENGEFTALAGLEGVNMGYCSHNAESLGIRPEAIDGKVARGSQYENSVMNHSADRVIVL